MIEELCTCNNLPAHQHIPERVLVRNSDGEIRTWPKHVIEMNPNWSWDIVGTEPPSIRLAVDWKAVAREQMRDA